jgi:hypothetical protein
MANAPVPPSSTLGREAVVLLREILADHGEPIAAPPVGARLSALRAAHDLISSQRLAARSADSAEVAVALLHDLERAEPSLAATLRWHATIAPYLAKLPSSRPRNALLGSIRRGELLVWATHVTSWAWQGGRVPDDEHTLSQASGEVEVDEFPALYDTILLWEPTASALVALPTHRGGLQWSASTPAADSGVPWTVTLERVAFHADELIHLEADPRTSVSWRAPGA